MPSKLAHSSCKAARAEMFTMPGQLALDKTCFQVHFTPGGAREAQHRSSPIILRLVTGIAGIFALDLFLSTLRGGIVSLSLLILHL